MPGMNNDSPQWDTVEHLGWHKASQLSNSVAPRAMLSHSTEKQQEKYDDEQPLK